MMNLRSTSATINPLSAMKQPIFPNRKSIGKKQLPSDKFQQQVSQSCLHNWWTNFTAILSLLNVRQKLEQHSRHQHQKEPVSSQHKQVHRYTAFQWLITLQILCPLLHQQKLPSCRFICANLSFNDLAKLDKWDFAKLRRFCAAKETKEWKDNQQKGRTHLQGIYVTNY